MGVGGGGGGGRGIEEMAVGGMIVEYVWFDLLCFNCEDIFLRDMSCWSRRVDISLMRKGRVLSRSVMVVESEEIVGEGMREGFLRQIWHENLNEGDFNTLTTCLSTALLVIQL